MSPPARTSSDTEFPCSIVISTPFPTTRLADTALQALQVDEELSPLVRRSLSLASSSSSSTSSSSSSAAADTEKDTATAAASPATTTSSSSLPDRTILRAHYRATTNRMLRVSVNGFFESIAVVLQIMQELDVDVLGMASVAGTETGSDNAGLEGPVGADFAGTNGKLHPTIEIGAK